MDKKDKKTYKFEALVEYELDPARVDEEKKFNKSIGTISDERRCWKEWIAAELGQTGLLKGKPKLTVFKVD